MQADSCGDVQMIVCNSDNADSSREECNIIADGDNNADTSLNNIHSNAVLLTQDTLSLAVDGEIPESTDETSANMSDVSFTRELDIVTPNDTCSGQVVDHSCANSYTADITGQPVINGNVSSESDSSTNHSLCLKAESVNLEPNHDVERNPEVNEEAARSLVEELADTGPAQSTGNKEPNGNGHSHPTRPNTMLSWSESSQDAATSKTKCAIQFENSVIFDLDVE